MNSAYCGTLIFGASFLGIGLALETDNCIVVESSGIFGAEFINTYRICKKVPVSVKTNSGKVFYSELKNRALINDEGEIYQAPAIYIMSMFLRNKSVDIRLMTEVIKIEKEDELFRITLYHVNGFEIVKAKRIIDTTTLGKGHKKAQMPGLKKSLNVIIHNPSNTSIDNLFFNKASGMFTYSLDVPLNLTRYEAIQKLCSMESVFKSNNMKISSIAPDFSYTLPEISGICSGIEIEKNFSWHPSAVHANIVAAFDEGAALGGMIA